MVNQQLGNGTTGGYAIITTPLTPNHNVMTTFLVKVYSSYHAEEYLVSGYAYGPPSDNWYSPKIKRLGLTRPHDEYVMGKNAEGRLYIAIPVNNYAGVSIHNITNGYSFYFPSGDWDISFSTTKPTENPVTIAFTEVYHSGNFDPDSKVSTSSIAQETGQSTTAVMSQKAVTDALQQSGGATWQ